MYISHPETNTLQIPFDKKSETEIPRKKYTYFSTASKKTEEFLVYDYMKHLTQYGFNCENTFFGFRYFVKIVGNKLQKRLTVFQLVRKKITLAQNF